MSVFVDLEKRLKGDFHLKVAVEAENESLALWTGGRALNPKSTSISRRSGGGRA